MTNYYNCYLSILYLYNVNKNINLNVIYLPTPMQ